LIINELTSYLETEKNSESNWRRWDCILRSQKNSEFFVPNDCSYGQLARIQNFYLSLRLWSNRERFLTFQLLNSWESKFEDIYGDKCLEIIISLLENLVQNELLNFCLHGLVAHQTGPVLNFNQRPSPTNTPELLLFLSQVQVKSQAHSSSSSVWLPRLHACVSTVEHDLRRLNKAFQIRITPWGSCT
jgi:hypothetical protein